ncbi:MarR family winged helix-turn-helix transcriptional regulator [Arthrobacter sp. 35W]|uniref:MarR family winged helix-turn-helix transcriptional regulator n=1 Tax=Arthrobacter sp. 35W TaxID=1132441 RepID=UPI00040CD8B6|nr:MarR family transcriptional regulator [Arthrobacter sp. 35W]
MGEAEEPTQWLSADERAAWLALLSTTTLLPAALDAELVRLGKLSLFDYNVLAMLSESAERRLPMSELAARTSASLSRLSHVAKKLAARGLVARSADPSDARVTAASITDEGMALVEELAPLHVAHVRRLVFDSLDARDVADLARIGRKVVGRLQEDHWILRTPSP